MDAAPHWFLLASAAGFLFSRLTSRRARLDCITLPTDLLGSVDRATKMSETSKAFGGIAALLIIGCVFLCCGGLIFLPGEHQSRTIPVSPERQRDAYEKFSRGDRLSDSDVDDLAGRVVVGRSKGNPQNCGIMFFVMGALSLLFGGLIWFFAAAQDSDANLRKNQNFNDH